MAVGEEYIVEAVNSGFQVFTKTGLQTRAYTDFSSFVNLPTPWNGFCFDPRVVYDPWQDRFVMLILGLDNTNLKSYFWIMVSQTSNPNGDWFLVSLRFHHGGPRLGAVARFCEPRVGSVGSVCGRQLVPICAEARGFQQSRLWTISREVMSGGTAAFIFMNDLRVAERRSRLRCASGPGPESQSALEATFFINSYSASGTEVCLWQLTGDRFSGQGMGATTLNRSAIAGSYLLRHLSQRGPAGQRLGHRWRRCQNPERGLCPRKGLHHLRPRLGWQSELQRGLCGGLQHRRRKQGVGSFDSGKPGLFHVLSGVGGGGRRGAPKLDGGHEHDSALRPARVCRNGWGHPRSGPPIVAASVWDRQGLGPYSVWDGGSEGVGKKQVGRLQHGGVRLDLQKRMGCGRVRRPPPIRMQPERLAPSPTVQWTPRDGRRNLRHSEDHSIHGRGRYPNESRLGNPVRLG